MERGHVSKGWHVKEGGAVQVAHHGQHLRCWIIKGIGGVFWLLGCPVVATLCHNVHKLQWDVTRLAGVFIDAEMGISRVEVAI